MKLFKLSVLVSLIIVNSETFSADRTPLLPAIPGAIARLKASESTSPSSSSPLLPATAPSSPALEPLTESVPAPTATPETFVIHVANPALPYYNAHDYGIAHIPDCVKNMQGWRRK